MVQFYQFGQKLMKYSLIKRVKNPHIYIGTYGNTETNSGSILCYIEIILNILEKKQNFIPHNKQSSFSKQKKTLYLELVVFKTYKPKNKTLRLLTWHENQRLLKKIRKHPT